MNIHRSVFFAATFAVTVISPVVATDAAPQPVRMAGLVSYSDWTHVYLKSPREAGLNLDHFFGVEGVRKIIQTSKKGGLSKLYWRTAGSASSYYPTHFDTDEDGDPDIETQGSYHFDTPSYRPVYKKEALVPDHIVAKPATAETSSRLAFGLNKDVPAHFGIRLLAKTMPMPGGGESGPFFYIAGPDSPAIGWPLTGIEGVDGKFRTFRIRKDGEGAALEVEGREIPSVSLPDVHSEKREIGIYWPAQCETGVAINAVQMISLPRLERDADAPADLYDSDFGPVVKGLRDTAWSKDVTATSLTVTETFGDPLRRQDYVLAYRSPDNPFGVGEDQISVAVREAHASGMKIFLWFTVGEENHYGSGPLSAFVRKHPEWREVDTNGNIWRGRLSLAFPEVRKYKVAMVQEAVERYRPDGVLLDFVRRGLRDPYHEEATTTHYPVRDQAGVSIFGYDAASLDSFTKKYPDVSNRPNNDLDEWVDWRAGYATSLITELQKAIPETPISVAVFSGSAEQARQGDLLDWQSWAENGLIQEIMFMLDNSKDGRPFVSPFGSPPKPIESVSEILSSRRKELPKGFPVTAGIYCYNIKSSTIPDLVAQAEKGGADEIAWWETTSLEWTEGYSGRAWRAIKRLAAPPSSTSNLTLQTK